MPHTARSGGTGLDGMQAQVRRFETALENMSQGICFFDGEQRLLLANVRYAQLYDIPSAALQPGMALREVIELRYAVGSCPRMTPDDYHRWRNQVAVSNAPSESVVELMNGRIIFIRHRPMPDGGWVATHEDITEQRLAAERIAFLAHHDPLTGLANRVLFQTRLEEAIQGAAGGEHFALLVIDLDRFKEINDTLGHPVGDDLLQGVAERLAPAFRDGDTVARLGGDEFAVILRRLASPVEAVALGRRVIETLSKPYDLQGTRLAVGASIGIALAPRDGTAADILLSNADIALYRAKERGRSACVLFQSEMAARLQRRRELETDLEQALAAEQFEVHYQPLLSVANRALSGVEALLRWRHPQRGMISPQEFIPLAEETGLIVPIGDWVLRRACEVAATLPASTRLAVNLSPIQLASEGLVDRIARALGESGLPASRLELEITESVMMHDTDANLETLSRLRALGIGVAMDDFGTGFSSLSALRLFPFTKVKIDRSFVSDLTAAGKSGPIVRAIADLCRVLGMTTLAEGIETEEQFRAVAASGCTEVQGFLLGRPMALPALRAFIAQSQRSATERAGLAPAY